MSRSVGETARIACAAATVRGTLAHSKLKNGFLRLRHRERLLRLLEEAEGRIVIETVALLDRLAAEIDTYSPTCLLAELAPLRVLPGDVLAEWREWLRPEFSTGFNPEAARAELKRLAEAFKSAIERFRQDKDDASFVDLQGAARELAGFLHKLPRGVWLP